MMNNREWDRILFKFVVPPRRMTRTEKLDLSAFSVQSATANLQNSIIILFMSQTLFDIFKMLNI